MRESIVTFTLGSNGETVPKYSKTVKVDTERGFTDFKQLFKLVDWFYYTYNNDNTQFRKNITSSYIESIEAKKRRK